MLYEVRKIPDRAKVVSFFPVNFDDYESDEGVPFEDCVLHIQTCDVPFSYLDERGHSGSGESGDCVYDLLVEVKGVHGMEGLVKRFEAEFRKIYAWLIPDFCEKFPVNIYPDEYVSDLTVHRVMMRKRGGDWHVWVFTI